MDAQVKSQGDLYWLEEKYFGVLLMNTLYLHSQ